MYEYSHGGNAVYENGFKDVLDLSANINPLGPPEKVKDAIIGDIENCDRYPDSISSGLCEKIAEYENVSPDWIVCGNGASDLIFRLPIAVRAKKTMVTAPAFSDYERSAMSFGSEIVRFILPQAGDFDIDSSFAEAVFKEKPDLVFVCNPNNPTGRLTKAGLIREILDSCGKTNAYLAVDECFLDFTGESQEFTSKGFLERYQNLIVLKSFTKIFGLPGLRLGYAICSNKDFIDKLLFHGADWPVSNLAQAAGIASLRGADDYLKKTVEHVSMERGIMETELARLGYRIFGSRANYIFLQNPYTFDLSEELNIKGIRIRSCANYHGLDETYQRIAVSTKENNEKALAEISEITRSYIGDN